MRLFPIFSFLNPNSASKHILDIVHHIQEQKSSIRLGIHSSMDILCAIDDSLQQQLAPFISSGRIHVFPDSLDLAFQGLMNIQDLEAYLKKSLDQFLSVYPELPALFIPRWHDYYREEARQLYRNILGTTLIPMRDKGNYYRILKAGSREQHIIPCVYPDDVGQKQFPRSLEKKVRKSREKVNNLITRNALHPQGSWDTMIMIDGEQFCRKALEALTVFARKKYEYTCGRPDIRSLCITRAGSNVLETEARASLFDLPYFGPEFIAQLFLPSRSKKKLSYSTALSLPAPKQQVVNLPSSREITTIMLSRAELCEQDFEVHFEGGNITSIKEKDRCFVFPEGIRSRVGVQKGGHEKHFSYEIETAFAVEGTMERGLRQIQSLKMPGSQIAGRISNDILLIGDHKELYIDSYIQHPWIHEEYSLTNYIPQMLVLWADVSKDTALTVSSRNTDATGRAFPVELSETKKRSLVFLPGFAWILDCGGSSIGIDLIYGKKQHIHLPAAVLIEKVQRKNYKISFLPIAEYNKPDTSIINGLMEHYTIRVKPGISSYEEFTATGKGILDHIAKPFIVYF